LEEEVVKWKKLGVVWMIFAVVNVSEDVHLSELERTLNWTYQTK
jgi:hypothetical protein